MGQGTPYTKKPVGHAANTTVVVGSGLYLRPCRADRHVTCPALGVGSYLHHLGHRVRKRQRGLVPRAQPARMLWRLPSPPPLSWEEQVQEEEDEQERHSSIGGDSQPCPSPAPMEGCSVSDVSMAEEGPQQGDSDIVVEEEVEENMETDEPPNIDAPAPITDEAFLESSKPEAEDDTHSHASEESMDQNPAPRLRP